MAALTPEKIAQLRELKGEPLVTYPWEDLGWPTTERLLFVPRTKSFLPYRSPEPDDVRFPNNRLVSQKGIEGGGDKHHREMYYRYEVLPSRPMVDTGTDEDSGQVVADVVWQDWAGAQRPARGSTLTVQLPDAAGTGVQSFGSFIVLDSSRHMLSWQKAQFSAKTMMLPLRRVERITRGFTFPAIFQAIYGPELSVGTPTPPPWLGTNYRYLPPRSGTWKGERVTTYSLGPQPEGFLPKIFTVFSPASATNHFRGLIDPFTIHNAFQINETGTDGNTYVVESFPASEPPSYQPGQVIVVAAEDKRWRGPIWRQVVEYVHETPVTIANWVTGNSQSLAAVAGEPNVKF